jgi:ABC-2 type transport system permease protein
VSARTHAAAQLGSRAGRNARLVLRTVEYELRKASAFRTGFVVREVLRGLTRPIVMIFVLQALYTGSGQDEIGGLDRTAATQYMLLLALFEKLVFHERVLDLSEQIFQGYVTKFLVMPFSFFVLPFGRFVQHTLLQIVVVCTLWVVGYLTLGSLWPQPASALALFQALVLVLLGSLCFLLWYFTLNCLAFWLDVVWSLLVMSRFIVSFVAGAVIPVAMMPAPVARAFEWLFPYWTITAPIELYSGRMGTPGFLRGLATLCVYALVLECVRRFTWRRGTARYAGSGM